MKNPALVLCTVSSNDYLHCLERLLASAQVNLPDARFCVVLVNVDELKIPYLESLYRSIEISVDYMSFDSVKSQRGYCANRRSSLFPELMQRFDCPIVWVDADSLFVKEASELIEYSRKYDLSVDYTADHPSLSAPSRKLAKLPKGPLGTPYYGVFNTSIITTNNSDVAKNLFADFSKTVASSPLSWYCDQEGLFLTYRKFQHNMKFNPLESRFCSREHGADTIIWTAKANMKDTNEYIQLGEEYVKRLRKWPLEESSINSKKQNESNSHISGAVTKKNIILRIYNRLYDSMRFLLTGSV